MERRVLIAIVLSFLVLYVYQAMFVKPAPAPVTTGAGQTASAPATAGSKPTAPPASQASAATSQPAASASAAAPAAPEGSTLVGDSAEHEVRFETNDVIAVFTNRGARLVSWRLKHYFDANHQPLELVANDLAATEPLPFSIDTGNESADATANTALYKVTGAPPAGTTISSPVDLKFEYRNTAGLHVTKQFHIEPSSYVIQFRGTVADGDREIAPSIVWGPGVGDSGTETSRYIRKPEGLIFVNGKVQRLSAKDIAGQPSREGDYRYAGVDDHYFMTVALFPGPSKVFYRAVSIPPPPGSKNPSRDLVAYRLSTSRPGEPTKFFFGPKDFDVLASIDRDLTRAIDFGIFAFLVVPLLRSLNWINGYIGNYGWSIILLTIIINAVMFPLRHKSVVSMRKMQEIQPEIKAIQERYAKYKATDPEKAKMNQEMMALYKTRGVNPASGCVPMLLTMPVLYAFYSLLSVAIELRGAPFFGWIHDLSAHDPLYITPVLMGISQMWQQKMTPTAGADPAQQKMMMVMPVVFTFMFLWAPAGLAIYWFMSNLWGIGQQYLTNYLIGPPKVHTVRPAAERRVKRVGGGKTEAAARES